MVLRLAHVRQFWNGKSPLLLGYSGGPDSKALLYSLLECGARVHVAHVDHGWREESAAEAEELRKEVERLGIPFHTTRLSTGRKEDEARKGRFAFFKKVAGEVGAQAVVLAHQADDWAETALKRTLEGAHLAFLGGMDEVSEVDGLAIWRPLLKVRRTEVLAYLKRRRLTAIEDPTNRDPHYLRARMREKILPELNEAFRKEIVGNLVCLAERGAELKRYLDRRVASIPVEREGNRVSVNLNGIERIEQRHLIQKISPVTIPRSVLEFLLDSVAKRASNRKVLLRSQEILVDRGMIFFFVKGL